MPSAAVAPSADYTEKLKADSDGMMDVTDAVAAKSAAKKVKKKARKEKLKIKEPTGGKCKVTPIPNP